MSQKETKPVGASRTVTNHTKRPIRLPTGQLLGTKLDQARQKGGHKMLCDKPISVTLTGDEYEACKKSAAFNHLVTERDLEVR